MSERAARTGADLFVETLLEYGVEHVFGNPGTTELPVMNALSRSQLDYVLGLHEDVAVGAAAGYAGTLRHDSYRPPDTCPVGVVNLHVAPGLAHGLANIQGAMFAGVPLVVTAGNHSTDHQHTEPILHGDIERMARQFTKWSAEVKHVDALPAMLRRAFRVALTPPTGPVFLGLPVDVMTAETTAEPEQLGAIPNAGGGDAGQIASAADRLIDAEDPVLVVGDGVARAGTNAIDAAVRLAEACGARVHGEILMGEVNFPTDHDQWVGTVAPSTESYAEWMDGDALAFVGCSTHIPDLKPDQPLIDPDATLLHLSDDAWQLGKNHPADVAVLGDVGQTMDAVAEAVEDELGSETAARRERAIATIERRLEREDGGQESVDADVLSKRELIAELQRVAPDAYLVNEAITTARYIRNEWNFESEGMISNKSGGLGYGTPATVGSAVAMTMASDSRPVVGVVGDGSYLYYPQAIYTAVRYDLDLTIVIPNNRNYRVLKQNATRLFGGDAEDHEYDGMDFDPPIDFVANAKSHGAHAERVDDPNALGPALERTLEQSGPSVLDVRVRDE